MVQCTRPQVRPPALAKQTNTLFLQPSCAWSSRRDHREPGSYSLKAGRLTCALAAAQNSDRPDPGSPVSEELQVVLMLLPGDHLWGWGEKRDVELAETARPPASEPTAAGFAA